MAEPLCTDCDAGRHSECGGDFANPMLLTCRCGWCKAWVDEHGPFSVPRDEPGTEPDPHGTVVGLMDALAESVERAKRDRRVGAEPGTEPTQ